MLSFKKNLNVPDLFVEAVTGLTGANTYDQLMADEARKDKALYVLLNEQGCLCPFCERRLGMPRGKGHPATLDHFLPQSRFPEIQVSYFNLVATCQKCNGLKDNHLLPAYIYDPQFDSTSAQIIFRTGRIERHFAEHILQADACTIELSAHQKALRSGDNILPKDLLLWATIELLQLNHRENLRSARAEVFSTQVQELNGKSRNALLRMWQKLTSGTKTTLLVGDIELPCVQFEEYLSLKIEVLKRVLARQGVGTFADFERQLGAL